MRKRVFIVIGTRPEAIKMVPLIAQLTKNKKYFETKICITQQHKELVNSILKFFNINTFSDKENIGIWYKDNEQTKKVAAIGVRISKWIAYHGFSINIDNNLDKYKAIIPCGIKDRGITNLKQIKDQDYKKLEKKLVEIFISNLNK